jgi:hypothetical protein
MSSIRRVVGRVRRPERPPTVAADGQQPTAGTDSDVPPRAEQPEPKGRLEPQPRDDASIYPLF